MANYNIMLRTLWLKKYNPQINWKQEKLTLEYKYMLNLESYH